MSKIMEPPAEHRRSSADAYRTQVLDALRGAARRGWIGPRSVVRGQPAASADSNRLFELDLLALSIKTALERLALPVAKTARALCDARVWSTFGYARSGDFAANGSVAKRN